MNRELSGGLGLRGKIHPTGNMVAQARIEASHQRFGKNDVVFAEVIRVAADFPPAGFVGIRTIRIARPKR